MKREIYRGKTSMRRWKQRLELCCHKPGNVKNYWQPSEAGRGKERFSPGVFTGSMALPKP